MDFLWAILRSVIVYSIIVVTLHLLFGPVPGWVVGMACGLWGGNYEGGVK